LDNGPDKRGTFSDYKNFDHRIRDMHNQNEASAFFKDDWKVRKSLTLNLGVRWAVFCRALGIRWFDAASSRRRRRHVWYFGTRLGRLDETWATCRCNGPQFVGKGSPNPDITWYPTTGTTSVRRSDFPGKSPGSAKARPPYAAGTR
jgi:hypothetical protein